MSESPTPRQAPPAEQTEPRRPAGSNGEAPKAPPPAAPKPRPLPLERELADAFSMAEGIALMAGDSYGAYVIGERKPHLAHAWAKLAKQNAQVRRIVEALVSGGAWGEAASITLATIIPILGHHGMVPAEATTPFMLGLNPPPSEEVSEAERQRGAVPPEQRSPEPGDGSSQPPPQHP